MRYTTSLNRNFQFRRMYRSAKSVSDKYLVLYYRKNRGQKNHLGITVSKKVGTAVVRNRIRRLIKENYRLHEEKIVQGYDLVIVARSLAATADFYQIRNSLLFLLKNGNLEKEER